MKTTKKMIRYYAIADWEEEEVWLRAMHQQGWKLRDGGFLYTFDRCEPEDVVYQLDYNSEGLANMDDYVQMFVDCGWEYIQNRWGYSYFRKPAAEMTGDEDGIFCDDASKLEMVKRVWNGRMVPILICFFLLILPNLASGFLGSNIVLLVLFGVLFLLYLWIFIRVGVKLWRLRQRYR